jgi:hypothetical protein
MAYASLSGANGLIINNGSANVATITNAGHATCTGLSVYKVNGNLIATVDTNDGTTIYNTTGTNGVARITADGSFSSAYGGQEGSTTATTFLKVPIPKNQMSILTVTRGGGGGGIEIQASWILYNVNFTSNGEYSYASPLTGAGNSITGAVSSDYSTFSLSIPSGSTTRKFVFSIICLGGSTYNPSNNTFSAGFNNTYT